MRSQQIFKEVHWNASKESGEDILLENFRGLRLLLDALPSLLVDAIIPEN